MGTVASPVQCYRGEPRGFRPTVQRAHPRGAKAEAVKPQGRVAQKA
jgi:hypothetical protein